MISTVAADHGLCAGDKTQGESTWMERFTGGDLDTLESTLHLMTLHPTSNDPNQFSHGGLSPGLGPLGEEPIFAIAFHIRDLVEGGLANVSFKTSTRALGPYTKWLGDDMAAAMALLFRFGEVVQGPAQ